MHASRRPIPIIAVIAMLAGASSADAAEYAAQLQWAQRLALSVPVSGVVGTVAVKAGDRVEKGQRLLALDARGFEAEVARANADLARLRETRSEALREQDRAEELFARTILSEHDLQVAKIAFTSADAEYQAARAALVLAELHVENSAIVAPIDAVVVQRLVEPGQTVVSDLQATPLLVLAARGRMQAQAALSADELAGLEAGAEAAVLVGAQRYPGRIVNLGLEPLAAAGDATPRYAVVVEFDHDDGVSLRAGQAARMQLP